MGTCIWLLCDKCKKIAFIGKTSPIQESLRMDNLEDFFFSHFSGLYGEDKYCDSSFRLISDNDDMPPFDTYEVIDK